jgi:hypothetical protein
MADDSPDTLTALDFARDSLGHGTHAIDLDGQVHGFTPSVRDALIERQLLTLDGSGLWRLHLHGAPDLHASAPLGHLACCDFCSARPVTWEIPCVSFTLSPPAAATPTPAAGGPVRLPEARSDGDWAACEDCGVLVSQGKRAALLYRCWQLKAQESAAADLPRDLRRALKLSLTDMHARFWRHYRSGARRVEPRPFGH